MKRWIFWMLICAILFTFCGCAKRSTDISLEEITLQKTELTDVKWISYAAMLDFLDHIDYRPEEYLSSVRTYIEDTIGSCLHNT